MSASRFLVLAVLGAATASGVVSCKARSSGAPLARPEPSAAVALASARPIDPAVPAGRVAYAKYCALCHGADARGYAADHAPSLVNETFLASATDAFLSSSIRDGRPGTAMAGYGNEHGGPLQPEVVTQLIAFLRNGRPAPAVPPFARRSGDAASGKTFYDAACQRCHGTKEARGEAPHLANSAFLSAATDGFLRHAIVSGRPGTPMPSFSGTLLDSEIDDVVAYVRSLGPASTAPAGPPGQPPEPPPENGPVVINPGGKPPSFKLREDRFVPAEQVKKALEARNRIVIIDARAASDWINAHIPGSISVPYYGMARLDALPKDGTWVVAYCACPHHASGVIVDELRKRGFPHTAVLDEGILEWQKRGYPIEPPKK